VANRSSDVDSFVAAAPDGVRPKLEALRRLILWLAPEAVESLSYGMAAYKYRGRPLTYFAVWKTHWALYALDTEAYRDALRDYEIGDKGTIKFPFEGPLPEAVITALVKDRIAAIDALPRKA
jgi:uncharacterized protein YdhG (YjbR/CyaY superfamily)